MPPRKKYPAWQFLYSFFAIVIAIEAFFVLKEIPIVAESKYRYLIVIAVIISFIIFAEKLFVHITKPKEDGSRGRNDTGG
mgnify:CR=1 FL=1